MGIMIVNTTNKFVPIISNLIFSPLSNPLVFRRKNGEKFSYNIEKNNRCSLKMNLNDLDEFKDSELDPETKKLKEKKAEIERLRAAEKFMEINEENSNARPVVICMNQKKEISLHEFNREPSLKIFLTIFLVLRADHLNLNLKV